MKRTVTIAAADKKVGITFDQVAELVHDIEASRITNGVVRITGQSGWKGRVLRLKAEWEVFPSGVARERGHL